MIVNRAKALWVVLDYFYILYYIEFISEHSINR
nr:MAG TPA: hypothetical protein [Ackermannviridae sp.]DAW82308.1 MAG TPA: hypothetical protein [Bacteriophage sp.]